MELIDTASLPAFPDTVYVARIDGAKARSLRSFYPRIAKALFFPDYFGKNLDALSDCLATLEVLGRPDVVLLINNYPQFLALEKPDKREAVEQVFRDAEVQENRYDAVRFRVIGGV